MDNSEIKEREKSCVERVQQNLDERIEDLKTVFYSGRDEDDEGFDEELGSFYDYGLSFDYVAPDTFGDQEEGYWRYQLSWGGPSDEFRFYGSENSIDNIEYWFLDWFDGAHIDLSGSDYDLLLEIFDDFSGMGVVQSTYEEATQ